MLDWEDCDCWTHTELRETVDNVRGELREDAEDGKEMALVVEKGFAAMLERIAEAESQRRLAA